MLGTRAHHNASRGRSPFWPTLLLILVASVSSCDWRRATGVLWEDIHSWKGLGQRWASAYDKNGKRIAIYDLSYPDLRRQIELGLIGSMKVRTKDLVDELGRAIQGSNPDERDPKLAGRLEKLAATDDYLDRWPEGWWERVPWAAEFVSRNGGRLASAPRAFTLGDLDLESVAIDRARYRQLVSEIEQEKVEEEPVLGPDFLKRFRFERIPEGGYRIIYDPLPAGELVSRPKRMIDLTTIHAGVVEKAVNQGIKTAINQIIGLIPIPIVSSLIKTAFGRWYHVRNQVWDIHLEMLAEMARIAEDPAVSPLGELSSTELFDSERSLVLSRASLAAIPTWLWRRPEKVWKKDGEKEREQSRRAVSWLSREGYETSPLNPRFWLATRGEDRRIYTATVKAGWFGDEPVVALDHARTEKIRDHRIFIERLSTAVDFATDLVPYVGGVVGWSYEQLVENPIDKAKRWEGRLKIALLESELASGDRSAELRALDRTKVNRIEPDLGETLATIAARRKWLGIQP